jgi:hypothetical protein
MEKIIDKKLLSAILGHGIRSFDDSCISPDGKSFFITDDNPSSSGRYIISIDELIKKAKLFIAKFQKIDKEDVIYHNIEEIFKACEHIRKELLK